VPKHLITATLDKTRAQDNPEAAMRAKIPAPAH